jgi:sRNA-binding carbon storage regulator CsrA
MAGLLVTLQTGTVIRLSGGIEVRVVNPTKGRKRLQIVAPEDVRIVVDKPSRAGGQPVS